MAPLAPCFFGGRGGGLIRMLATPRGGGSGTSSSSAEEVDSRELASEEQDFSGDAGDSELAEKSTGNGFSSGSPLLFATSISKSLQRVDMMGLEIRTNPCTASVVSFTPGAGTVGTLGPFGAEESSGGRDTDNG